MVKLKTHSPQYVEKINESTDLILGTHLIEYISYWIQVWLSISIWHGLAMCKNSQQDMKITGDYVEIKTFVPPKVSKVYKTVNFDPSTMLHTVMQFEIR